MRVLLAGLVVVAMGTGGCALIAGLKDYEGHAESDSATPPVPVVEGGSLASDDDASSTPLNGDEEPSPDAESTPDVDPSDGFFILSGDIDSALLADVNTTCDTTTCSGCCENGMCVGGQSVATCGTGGEACKNCTSMGGACTSGACATKAADAGAAKTCTVKNCSPCIPVYQSSCCKTDMTCGCHTNFGGNGQCN